MPRGLKIHANERIDLADFEHGTRDFINERVELEAERSWLDAKSRILDGFRIELADQTTSPGQFTIYNGNAFDRDGRRLTNEDEDNASRSSTLSAASTTYYVEVEFVETDTDTDARAFWDPTYDNGTSIPYDGKEFSQNVATRVSYDWTIVSPISTTGFQSSTDANSTRIPVAQLSTDAVGQITLAANPGLSTVPVASVAEADAELGASTIRVHDARFFPDSGSVVIGVGLGTSETKSISIVDRRNGLISVTTPFANAHGAGEVVRMSGTGRMLLENTLPSNVSETTSTHPDKRRRFFQGDEFRGSALLSSKDSSGRDDLNMRNIKDYVDFLSAQIREMRWGSPNVGENSVAPPTSFTPDARYYTASAGISGSRTATVTVGNGTTSWGDLNGTTDTVFNEALAALPAAGGIVFVKNGTYTFGSQVAVTKPVRIIGEGRDAVTVNHTGSGYAFDVTVASDDVVEFSHLTVTATTDLIIASSAGTCVFEDCLFEGLVAVDGSVHARNTQFMNSTTAVPAMYAFAAINLVDSSFESCRFDVNTVDSTNAGIRVTTSASQVSFNNCQVDGPTAVSSTGTFSNVSFTNCSLAGVASSVTSTGSFTQTSFNNCSLSTSAASNAAPTLSFTSFTNSFIDECVVSTAPSGATTLVSPHRLLSTTGSVGGSVISDTTFKISSGSGFVTGVYMLTPDATAHLGVSGCTFLSLTYGVHLSSPVAESVFTISGSLFDGADVLDTRAGVYVVSAADDCQVRVQNCTFKRMAGSSAGCYGVYFDGLATSSTAHLNVTGCSFLDMTGFSTRECIGVYILHNDPVQAVVSNNEFHNLSTVTGVCYAVQGTGSDTLQISVQGNLIRLVFASSATGRALTFDSLIQSTICGNSINGITGLAPIYSIAVTTADDLQITGNTLDDSITVGSGSSYITISNNTIRMSANQAYGISYSWASTEVAVQIANNVIACNTGADAGIHLSGTVGTLLRGGVVSGNVISGLNASYGIYVAEGLTEGLVIRGNSIIESTFNADNAGITVLSSTANGHIGLIINDNSVVGCSSGGAARNANKYAIYLTDATGFSVSNNTVVWNRSATGNQISIQSGTITDLVCGAVNGNAVVADSGGDAEIEVNCSEVICAGNVVSTSSTAGSINVNSSLYAGPATIGTNGTFGYNHI